MDSQIGISYGWRKLRIIEGPAGGPGCSSELAFFYENGPYHITPELGLELNEYGWDVNNNMIYVDQPINTGFSYSEVHHASVPNPPFHPPPPPHGLGDSPFCHSKGFGVCSIRGQDGLTQL